jgi:hypothetical protein
MASLATLPCEVHPVADGVLVVPAILPIHIPTADLDLTVAQWIGTDPTPRVAQTA